MRQKTPQTPCVVVENRTDTGAGHEHRRKKSIQRAFVCFEHLPFRIQFARHTHLFLPFLCLAPPPVQQPGCERHYNLTRT